MTEKSQYTCGKCGMFACPILMKNPKVQGCNYGPDILNQIKKAKKAKSRDFENICKELGICTANAAAHDATIRKDEARQHSEVRR